MNGRQIEIFYAVMKTGTVTEAAKFLGITQPSVTSTLQQIEKVLGFNLFHRVRGRLNPTAEARILYGEAEYIQQSLQTFRGIAERLKNDLTSHLRVAALHSFSHELIPEAIAEFAADTDDCILDITPQHHDQIISDIASSGGQNNLGFTFGTGGRSGIGSTLIGQAKIVALIPQSWDLARKADLSIADLSDKPLIGTFTGEPLGDAVEKLMREAGLSTNYSIRAHTHSVAATLVSKAVGATIIDSVTAHYARARMGSSTFAIIPVIEAPVLPVTAVFSYEHPLSKHAKKLIQIFRKNYRRLAGDA
ncbi:MAG: LysR family transcriptional regulator [Kordiimonadaceae bacterium]|nr:LysR family transcriptional regulator [Kordiimonadaceae bacterium]